jgi:MFS family permease
MPFLLLMYVIAFLDRVNIGFAKQAFQAHAGISAGAYALGAGLFFIGYAIFEVPSNVVLRRVGARWWLCRIMITWGVVSAAMALVNDETTYYVLRFLLGAAEAGFFPGVILYITYWVPHAHRSRCNGLFYFGIPLSSALGGPLSGALLELDGVGGLAGMQWMFLVEGLLACAFGVWGFFLLDNGPAEARWLTAEQRTALLSTLEKEEAAKSTRGPTRLWPALVDPRVLLFSLIYFLIQCGMYGMTFSLPTQVASLVGGHVGFAVGAVTAIPWVVALVANYALSRSADRLSQANKRYLAGGCVLAGSLGIVASGAFGNPVLAIAGLSVAAAGYVTVQPVFWTFPAAYLTGPAAAGGIALINSLGNLGGFVAPSAKNFVEQSLSSSSAGLFGLAACGVVAAALFLVLSRAREPEPAKEMP